MAIQNWLVVEIMALFTEGNKYVILRWYLLGRVYWKFIIYMRVFNTEEDTAFFN